MKQYIIHDFTLLIGTLPFSQRPANKEPQLKVALAGLVLCIVGSVACAADVSSPLEQQIKNICTPNLMACATCGPDSCGTPCCATEREPGSPTISYPSNCTEHVRPQWRVKAGGGLTCHLDLDRHIDGIDVEIYAVDLMEDLSCVGRSDRYQKSRKAKVSCSFFTAFLGSRCDRRVARKVKQLAARGYIPITSNLKPDRNRCPSGGPTCTSSAQCDDGAYCNGIETCYAGACISGTPPCSGQACNEASDSCRAPPRPRPGPDCGPGTGVICP